MNLLKWSTINLAPQMRPPVNIPEVWGTKPAWADTNWSVEVPAPDLLSSSRRMPWQTSPFVIHPFYVIYQTRKNHTGVEIPAKQELTWEGFQISLTETFLKKTSGSIVHTRSKIAVEVLWVWLGAPGAWHPPLIDIAFFMKIMGVNWNGGNVRII